MGKFTIKSPLKHVNTAGSTDHFHNGKPHPPEQIVEIPENMKEPMAGTVPGMFAIPMGIYNRYKDYQQKVENRRPKTTFDPSKVEAMKYKTELIEREKTTPGTIKFEILKLGT